MALYVTKSREWLIPQNDFGTSSTMGEQPRAATLRGAQKRDVYLTGFGKFGDIVDNPTTFIVQEIVGDANVTEALVLEVSAEGLNRKNGDAISPPLWCSYYVLCICRLE
jgi:hypothetical protein